MRIATEAADFILAEMVGADGVADADPDVAEVETGTPEAGTPEAGS